MIKIYLGNVGSGKTVSAVREIINNSNFVTYSNIQTKRIKNNVVINKEMIIKKELLFTKKSGEEMYKYSFNKDFWINEIKKNPNMNIIIDEAHTVLNSRRAMSKQTQCILDFIALIRKILGSSSAGQGSLILISQLERRLDPVASEMATQIKFHICHYVKTCRKCGFMFHENNEAIEIQNTCIKCGSYNLLKHSHVIEVYQFPRMEYFVRWKYLGLPFKQCGNRHYLINDIEKYFGFYNTLQWENLFSD
jgi:ferredoxin-like protein FixX